MPNPTAKIRLEAEPALGPGINQALREIQGLSGKVKGLLTGAFAGISVAGLTAIVNKTLEFGDALNAARIKAAVTGEAISELAYAAKQSNVELGGLSNSLRFMQKFLSEARTGGKEQAEALQALGLSIKDLKALRPDEAFERLGDQIRKLSDPSDRARAALAVFGKAGADLLPLFEDGAEGIRKLREEAQKIGQSFSTEQLKQLDAAKDSIDRMKAAFEGLATALIARVSPALTEFFTALTPGLSSVDADIAALEETVKTGRFQSAVGGGRLTESQLATARQNLDKLRAVRREMELQGLRSRAGAGARPHRGDAVGTPVLAGAPPGFLPEPKLEEIIPSVSSLFNRDNILRGSQATAIEVGDLVDIRFDQFGEDMKDTLLATTEDTSEQMTKMFEKPFGEMTVFAEQAARNMQDAFAQFLFDPFEDGLRGMLTGFLRVIQRMVAEIAAAQIFGSKKSGGLGLGDFLSGLIGGLFGGDASGLEPVKTTVSRLPTRASGGPVSAGRAYLVGERGPEMFIPNQSGAIAAGGAPAIVINNYMDNRGATAEFINQIPALMRANNEALKADIMDTISRRPPPRIRR